MVIGAPARAINPVANLRDRRRTVERTLIAGLQPLCAETSA
jgi:hypothetical protein